MIETPTHTTEPIVTGSSVLGVQCVDGVVLACDTLASYGSLARFQRITRLHQPAPGVVIAGGGEYSDLQQLFRITDNIFRQEFCQEDGYELSPRALHSYLARVLYGRRSRMDPLYNSLAVAGKGRFLGCIDLYGTAFESEAVATGIGALLALPLIRKQWHAALAMDEGVRLLEECLRVLYYRDCRALRSVQVAKVSDSGEVLISEPYELSNLQWKVAQAAEEV
ncbi:20S core proteasome subunit beta 7 [Cyanidioschyzon merolae strain 10D]|jgi:20S proteasome subunit beta 7|uniref:Proteasome subunit beta n=1 Tax=Cyanidioschyzon merolae (strain NIES-3377 / 10D) TaxID=280699 RepID=M1VF37_CYAM1|nr:20S core proteasome subunit beta 7 [Cyanidioschyzon merolae strain 10D]BAM79143.1 20S core proteasome subunit beta 7 [Cyanidioschyzon merolae strain 10D]|eukprot:XP_005535429.1 20S core proteasome subunit beta 7 [Cyanidioschyzon merolae strain 10D]